MNDPYPKWIEPGVVRGEWWHRLDDGRIQCDLCPRFCKLQDATGHCRFCGTRLAGYFDPQPGHWGATVGRSSLAVRCWAELYQRSVSVVRMRAENFGSQRLPLQD